MTMTSTTIQTESILHRQAKNDITQQLYPHHEVFGYDPEDKAEDPTVLAYPVFLMPSSKWEELGEPHTITCTIRPGDWLNAVLDADPPVPPAELFHDPNFRPAPADEV